MPVYATDDLPAGPPSTYLNQFLQMDAIELMANLADKSVDAIFTDPPYNVTNLEFEGSINWLGFWEQTRRICKGDRSPAVLFSQQPFTTDLISSNRDGFRYEIIWEKNVATGYLNAKRRPLSCHENILVFADRLPVYQPQMRPGEPYKNNRRVAAAHYNGHKRSKVVNDGTRYPRSVVGFKSDPERFTGKDWYHPTQKPVGLMEWLILTYTRPGAVILDPFSGSGTTAIAARNTGRQFICGDISEEYVEMARERFSQPFTESMFK